MRKIYRHIHFQFNWKETTNYYTSFGLLLMGLVSLLITGDFIFLFFLSFISIALLIYTEVRLIKAIGTYQYFLDNKKKENILGNLNYEGKFQGNSYVWGSNTSYTPKLEGYTLWKRKSFYQDYDGIIGNYYNPTESIFRVRKSLELNTQYKVIKVIGFNYNYLSVLRIKRFRNLRALFSSLFVIKDELVLLKEIGSSYDEITVLFKNEFYVIMEKFKE